MPIVSSTILEDAAQRDGRRWIRERHTDQLGVAQVITYLGAANTDAAAVMAARVSVLDAALIADEIVRNVTQVMTLGSLAVYTFLHSTVAQNAAALRAAYLIATQLQAIMIGDALSILTNVQLQTAFGLTAGQVTTLRTNKLTPAAALAADIRASVGQ